MATAAANSGLAGGPLFQHWDCGSVLSGPAVCLWGSLNLCSGGAHAFVNECPY
jgi:hypothetical protein